MGHSLSVGVFMHRKDSLESSSRSKDTSIGTNSCVMDSTRVLDLDNKIFVCSNFMGEDPYGYSSRVYYRSNVNVGEGLPFQWETQPGKPKTDHEHHGVKALPLSPPPSFFSSPGDQNMYKKNKQIRSKSWKIHGPCAGCNPFSFKKV
ncbi:hypothetical protein SUGI_0246170 [Cryptomeria japonica]|nr:hypothetical protein SUGI_0246170 [Cryptomeria japonica]